MKLTRDAVYLVIIALLIAACGQFYYSYQYKPQADINAKREVKIYYNQDIEANKKVIEVIHNADRYIYFAIYTFTREDIKDALLGAHHRGIEVRGVIDRDQSFKIENQKKIVKDLKDAGIPLAFQDHSAIMHLKTLVSEKEYITGSYNWTSAATNLNDEVLEIGRDPELRDQYERVVKELLRRYQH
ncbi:MAG: phospholipase D-like domain-containing protein [bacterium]|nr:phospholipase D-like domain-containing protein [bacterium]